MYPATGGIAQSRSAILRLECKTLAEWGSVPETGSHASGPDFECQFRFHVELTAQAIAGVISDSPHRSMPAIDLGWEAHCQ